MLEDPIPFSLAAFEEVLAASRIGVEGAVTASIRSLGIFFSLAESVFDAASATFDQTYGTLASASANRRGVDGRGPDEKNRDAAAIDRAGEEGRERVAEVRSVVGRTWGALGESASEALRGFQDVAFLGFDLIEQNARDSANLTRALAAKTRRIATEVDGKTGAHHLLDVEDLQNLEQEAAEQQAELLGTIASRVAETSSVGIERSWKAAEGALTPLARQAEAAARLFTRRGDGAGAGAAG
ncbi:hypothetical protein [Rhodospirillum rubrum]|uniref:hypothetical protein n=1 Tax=Rhodospirillum rubrum TaxID=1085 RepID=UPI00003C2E54|nr:hypothetical protein [Rhodospirillum rubrum]